MDLNTQTTPAVIEKITYTGSGTYTVTAGQNIKIKTAGQDRLSVTCPSGKTWNVKFTVFIEETVE